MKRVIKELEIMGKMEVKFTVTTYRYHGIKYVLLFNKKMIYFFIYYILKQYMLNKNGRIKLL